jgi:ribosomal protein S18 acetylase RimI-like enzyme
MLQIRHMTEDDIPALHRIQAECYSPMMQEDDATLRGRLRLAPDTAWVAEDEVGVCAYLVGYRSRVGKVTPLNGLFDIPANADALYLHDLAVSGRCKGRGVGTALVQAACRQAEEEGLAYSALVSVQGSRAFWQGLGYAVWEDPGPVVQASLDTYEGPAYYMVKDLRNA